MSVQAHSDDDREGMEDSFTPCVPSGIDRSTAIDEGDDIHLILESSSTVGGGSSWVGAVFLIVNAALGAGLLNFPAAFNQAGGIFISMTMQAVFLALATISLLLLAYCAKKHSCSTYQEVMYRTCGRRMERVCSTFIALYCYGTCITFLVIIGDLSDRTFDSLYGNTYCHYIYMDRRFVITAISCLLILPLCFPKKIDFLKYPSSLGVIAVFYLVVLIMYEYYSGDFPPPPEVKTSPDHWEDVLTVIPVICFGYQCHVSSVPIYSCMKDKRVNNFSKSIFAAILVCGVVYSISGIFGYLTFGTNVVADVLMQYNAKHPAVLIGLIALGLKIITTYPILMFCGRLAVEDLIPKRYRESSSSRSRFLRRLTLSLFWFVTSVLLACVVPNIGVVIQCIGSMAALFIFVFPALAILATTIQKDPLYIKGQTKIIIAYALLSVGLGMFVFGQVLCKSLLEIINGDDGGQKTINLCV